MNRRFLISLGLTAALLASSAFAQTSGKPVRIVVSLLAGSAIDFQARLLAPHLSASLGRVTIVTMSRPCKAATSPGGGCP